MAASTHTPHYNLSQFGPDDRPSWIDDYNTDMRNIDTALAQGGSQPEPLFSTIQVMSGKFTASNELPYTALLAADDGNITVDYDTNTIHITKSGYYAVSGYAYVSNLTIESGDDKSLQLEIKYHDSQEYELSVASVVFNKSYEPSEHSDYGMVQSCSIAPVMVPLNAGDTVTMMIRPKSNSTIHGRIGEMYLTLESKKLYNAIPR